MTILCIKLYFILTDKIYFTMSFKHLLHAAEKAGLCDWDEATYSKHAVRTGGVCHAAAAKLLLITLVNKILAHERFIVFLT